MLIKRPLANGNRMMFNQRVMREGGSADRVGAGERVCLDDEKIMANGECMSIEELMINEKRMKIKKLLVNGNPMEEDRREADERIDNAALVTNWRTMVRCRPIIE